jgi:hypothetical protein
VKDKSEEITQTTLRIPVKLLVAFKMQSAKERCSMSNVMVKLIKEYLSKKGGS